MQRGEMNASSLKGNSFCLGDIANTPLAPDYGNHQICIPVSTALPFLIISCPPYPGVPRISSMYLPDPQMTRYHTWSRILYDPALALKANSTSQNQDPNYFVHLRNRQYCEFDRLTYSEHHLENAWFTDLAQLLWNIDDSAIKQQNMVLASGGT